MHPSFWLPAFATLHIKEALYNIFGIHGVAAEIEDFMREGGLRSHVRNTERIERKRSSQLMRCDMPHKCWTQGCKGRVQHVDVFECEYVDSRCVVCACCEEHEDEYSDDYP